MTITKTQNGSLLTVALEGRLDTITAPDLEQALADIPGDVTDIVFDMTDLEYISSAGLRILLTAKQRMQDKGTIKLTNVNETVSEILDITGFSMVMTIE